VHFPHNLIFTTKFLGITCIRHWRMNMLTTSQYQPRLLSINNIAPGGSANQIAVFTSN